MILRAIIQTKIPSSTHKARGRVLLGVALSLSTCAAACSQKPAETVHQAATTTPQPRAALSRWVKKPKEAEVSVYRGLGVVTRTNPSFPSVEINHEAIKDHMPPMLMEWYVKDISLLKSIKPGDKVEFTLEVPEGGTEIITELRKL
jgi:Cu/Ag efflux protein CusF